MMNSRRVFSLFLLSCLTPFAFSLAHSHCQQALQETRAIWEKACGIVPHGNFKLKFPTTKRRAPKLSAVSLRMGLVEWLRGGVAGSNFQRKRMDGLGFHISPGFAVLLAFFSLVSISIGLPLGLPGVMNVQVTDSYWLSRIVFLRALGFVYFVAFTVAFQQNTALLGDDGLLPAKKYLQKIRQSNNGILSWKLILRHPTLLWLANSSRNVQPEQMLSALAIGGMALSASVMLLGASNMLIQTSLWVLYHSINTVGQRFYSFGWESQLLETGFLSIFLVPMVSLTPLPEGFPTPWVCIWGFRWLLFRIMIGAGLIKIRGDSCWRDLTAMAFHYETQPVPNPLSYYLHFAPMWWHKTETMVNHVVELVVPWLLLLPSLRTLRPLRISAGLLQLAFQAALIASGNLSFLNWLTMLPAILVLDDGALAPMFSAETLTRVTSLNHQGLAQLSWGGWTREIMHLALAALLIALSAPVVQNLLSPKQLMNTSFGSLKLVNTYGAFGSISRHRFEVILSGTAHPDPLHASPMRMVRRGTGEWPKRGRTGEEEATRGERDQLQGSDGLGGGMHAAPVWLEYEFKVKPGGVMRRPALISPSHYRLDWLMWFLPLSHVGNHPWFLPLLAKLLVNDAAVCGLLEHNPFGHTDPPRFVRAQLYRYTYAAPGSPQARAGQWWVRADAPECDYVAPVSLADVQAVLERRAA